jgi:hypothetical protein
MAAMKHSADETVAKWYAEEHGHKKEVTSVLNHSAPESGDVEVTVSIDAVLKMKLS